MASVTALETDARGGGVRVVVDGAPFATVDARDLEALGLGVGIELTAEGLARLERRAEIFSARAVALRMLAYRALPSQEIIRRLSRKGHDRRAAEEAVGALVDNGLVDDVEFARHFTRTRAARHRYGPGRLAHDLRRLGVGERDAALAVQQALEAEGVDPPALLREAAVRKLRSLDGVEPGKQRRRLKAYLLRRGFAPSDVIAVLKELLAR